MKQLKIGTRFSISTQRGRGRPDFLLGEERIKGYLQFALDNARHDETAVGLLADLHPLAEQAARILSYLSNVPEAMSSSDQELAARIGHVSAQHVSLVIRALVDAGLAARKGFSAQLVTTPESLTRFAQNLQGVSIYLRSHKDADAVRLVLTEPGDERKFHDVWNLIFLIRPSTHVLHH
jgi:hypothetical protein